MRTLRINNRMSSTKDLLEPLCSTDAANGYASQRLQVNDAPPDAKKLIENLINKLEILATDHAEYEEGDHATCMVCGRVFVAICKLHVANVQIEGDEKLKIQDLVKRLLPYLLDIENSVRYTPLERGSVVLMIRSGVQFFIDNLETVYGIACPPEEEWELMKEDLEDWDRYLQYLKQQNFLAQLPEYRGLFTYEDFRRVPGIPSNHTWWL